MRAGFAAGVFGLFSPAVATVMVILRAFGVFIFSPPDKTGLKTLGDFNLSFLLLAVFDVAVETLACLVAGWKNGFATGDPKTKVADLLRFVTAGLKAGTSTGLPTLFLFIPTDCRKLIKTKILLKLMAIQRWRERLMLKALSKSVLD